MNGITFLINLTIIFNKVSGKLYPADESPTSSDLSLPNEWSSVKDCPVRYYEQGRSGLAGPVAGQDAYEREFAHMAAIGWTDENGQIEWNCGGSLISENYILTAGHCLSYKGKAPDVARMGDLNLESDADNQFAQQISIEKVIPHPLYTARFRYNDIALLKLSESIKAHDTVCPACLWINDTIKFHLLEACGYGQVGFLDKKTPKLQKVTLSPVGLSECSEYYPPDRRLNEGLKDTQICAIDRKLIMDTCLGDSGGPLQIKLLGNAKMNPFLIGVTSFGKACADHTPGVYTKISAYIDWIESVTQIESDPKKCAFKYQKYREFEPDVVTKDGDAESINSDKVHVATNPGLAEYLVKVGWSQGNNVDWRCNAALITEKFVLTSASCLKLNGKNPDKVMTRRNTDNIFLIKLITNHPNYVSNRIDNDISLIELENEVTFFEDGRPACMYSRDEIPDHIELELLGLGYRQSLSIFPAFVYNENPTKELVLSRSRPINNTLCSKFYELDGIQLNEERQICYGNIDYYLVPDTCQIALGAPLEREFWTTDRYHPFIIGLPMHGNDCGFGFPVIATKISHYIDWIDSVIFKNNPQDSCILPNGIKSACKRASACPHLVQQIKEGKSKLMDYLCRFDDNRDPLVCCPEIKRINQKYDFESCPQKNLELRRRWNENKKLFQLNDEYAHLTLIGYEATKEWHCRGNLITDKHVLSSSECVNSESKYDAVALGNVDKVLYRIQNTVTNENFLALITLESGVSFSKNIIPICLWLDKDRIPFNGNSIVSKVNETLLTERVRPHRSSECQGYGNSIKNDDKSCISFPLDSICTSPGTGIQAIKNESGIIVPYLVGQLYDVNKIYCPNNDDDELFYQFSKIAYNVDWILDNI